MALMGTNNCTTFDIEKVKIIDDQTMKGSMD